MMKVKDVVFIWQNWTELTITQISKELNLSKDTIRQVIKDYKFREYEDNAPVNQFIYDVFNYYNNSSTITQDLAESLGYDESEIRRKRRSGRSAVYKREYYKRNRETA